MHKNKTLNHRAGHGSWWTTITTCIGVTTPLKHTQKEQNRCTSIDSRANAANTTPNQAWSLSLGHDGDGVVEGAAFAGARIDVSTGEHNNACRLERGWNNRIAKASKLLPNLFSVTFPSQCLTTYFARLVRNSSIIVCETRIWCSSLHLLVNDLERIHLQYFHQKSW